jgi:hypothetical protein
MISILCKIMNKPIVVRWADRRTPFLTSHELNVADGRVMLFQPDHTEGRAFTAHDSLRDALKLIDPDAFHTIECVVSLLSYLPANKTKTEIWSCLMNSSSYHLMLLKYFTSCYESYIT